MVPARVVHDAYRYVGGPGSRGPFGTIRVGRPGDIPSNAALRIGLLHGPGGGANSDMACTLEGIAIESGGSYGQRAGGPARGYNHSMFHDWFYLPGPIVGAGAAPAPTPTVPGAIYLGRDDRSPPQPDAVTTHRAIRIHMPTMITPTRPVSAAHAQHQHHQMCAGQLKMTCVEDLLGSDAR